MDTSMDRRGFLRGMAGAAFGAGAAESKAREMADRIARGLLPQEDRRATHGYTDQSTAEFIEETLGADLWESQEAICDALDRDRFVAVRSCHAVGKSFTSARVALAFLHRHEHSIVVTTAPTNRQVKNILWRNINTAAARVPDKLLGRPLQTSYEIEPDWYAIGFKGSNDNSDSFQGFHCLDEKHTILTRRGWLGIDEITEDDEVLSVPNDGDTAEWMPVTAVHQYDFDGELNVHEGRFVDFAVTDDHRFPSKYAKTDSHWKMRRMRDVAGQFTARRVAGWEGQPFEVPEPFAARGMIPERAAELIGFWTGDGGTRTHSETGRTYEVLFYQTKDDDGYLDRLLDGLPTHRGRDHRSLSDLAMAQWLCEHVGRLGDFRRIPRAILDSTPEIIDAWLEGFWRAEGSYYKGERRTVYNSAKALMGDVQEALIKLGRPASLSLNTPKGTAKQSPHGEFIAPRDCWCLSWVTRPADATIKRTSIRRERYTGRVWCISTPYETFYTRRNGRVVLSGNSEHILLIVDEAAGVPEAVFDAADAILTGEGASCLLIGNPTSTSGTFRDAFHRNADLWHGIKISAYDSPNFTTFGITREDMLDGSWRDKVGGRKMPYPALIDPSWVARQMRRHGPDSAFVTSRIDADFPDDAGDTLIPLSALEACDEAKGELIAEEGTRFEVGIDVARYGEDETSITLRRGPEYHGQVSWGKHGLMETVGRIEHELTEGRFRGTGITQGNTTLKVDVIGMGAGVAERLAEKGWTVVEVNVAASSSDKEAWPNLRHELWWQLRERIMSGRLAPVAGVSLDEVGMAQASDVKFSYTSTHTMPRIETKEEARRRGVSSPDRAESWMLAFGQMPPAEEGPLGFGLSGSAKGRW